MTPATPDFRPILDHVGRLIPLSEPEKNLFTSLLRFRRVRKRQYLVQQGAVAQYEIFVVKGCLRAFYIDDHGKEYVVQFAVEDWWTSDLRSFLTQTPADYYVEALEDSEVFLLEYAALEDLYNRVPQFNKFFRIQMQRAFIALQQRIISAHSKTAEQRYEEFVKRYPNIEQRVPQYMVASYLGFTPEFLSRLRQQRTSG
ncbi:MAG TPA: Crp/Fnr family transcriptional regulator [Cytophagales bacterium]|jgi:CRP-like cAMP-binding protein